MKFSISLGQKMPRMSVYMACRISVNSLGLDGVKERTFSPSQEIVWRLSENVKWMNRLVNIYTYYQFLTHGASPSKQCTCCCWLKSYSDKRPE